MGTDRSRPYEQRETHDLIEPEVRSHDGNDTREVKARGRFLKGFGYISRAGVRKYTYVTDRYALGCTYEGRQDDIIWTGQARRWSLDFVTPGPMGKCFFTHPLRDGQGIPRNYWKNWMGSSRYEQVLQHKSTLIAIYNIPRNGVHYAVHSQPMQADEFPFIDGFFGGFRLIRNDPSGWIFCHGGSALVAVRTLRPGQWLTRDDLLEHTLVGRCYRSNGHRNAVVMEVEPSRLDGDVREQQMEAELTAFAGEILASWRIDGSAMEAERPSLVCVDRRGTRLELEYDGARRIDGEELDFESWPLLSNPWVHAEVGDGELHWRMPERQVME